MGSPLHPTPGIHILSDIDSSSPCACASRAALRWLAGRLAGAFDGLAAPTNCRLPLSHVLRPFVYVVSNGAAPAPPLPRSMSGLSAAERYTTFLGEGYLDYYSH